MDMQRDAEPDARERRSGADLGVVVARILRQATEGFDRDSGVGRAIVFERNAILGGERHPQDELRSASRDDGVVVEQLSAEARILNIEQRNICVSGRDVEPFRRLQSESNRFKDPRPQVGRQSVAVAEHHRDHGTQCKRDSVQILDDFVFFIPEEVAVVGGVGPPLLAQDHRVNHLASKFQLLRPTLRDQARSAADGITDRMKSGLLTNMLAAGSKLSGTVDRQ